MVIGNTLNSKSEQAMAVVITLSSDSESESEVEIVGSYSNKNELLPLSSVRVEVNDLTIPTPRLCIHHKRQRSAHAGLNIFSRLNTAPSAVVDLTEENDQFWEDNNLPSDSQRVEVVLDSQQQSAKTDFKTQGKFAGNSRKDPEETKFCVGRRILRSQKDLLIKKLSCDRSASVALKRLSIIENHLKELLTLDSVCVIKTGEAMSLQIKHDYKDTGNCPDLSNTTTLKGHKPFTEAQQDKACHGKATESHQESPLIHCSHADDIHLEHQISHPAFTQDTDELSTIPSPACASSSVKEQSIFSRELRSVSPSLPIGTSTVQPPLSASRNSSPDHPIKFLCENVNSFPETIPNGEVLTMTELPDPLCDCDEMTIDKVSGSCSQTPNSLPSVCRTINLDEEPFTYEDDFGVNSPVSFSWGESQEEKETSEVYCKSATQGDKYYVCPAGVKNQITRGADVFVDEEDGTRKPQMLCRQSLSMVYSTIDESYQEGTLELLSDLLLPGYYPPKDITSHLLWGILLNPQSPHHICVQAFDLLMRTQRYHIADIWSAPWDWEMLSNVMEKQEHRPVIVCMFLEYVFQTLEDDFKAKQHALHQSLAKAILSCDHQFSHIRDVCQWLFSAIVKSTDCNDMATEYIRIVDIFQRMLSLALEVDCSPAIGSAKLSQELFHMVISSVQLRPQRMLLLESLQSKLIRCKLLEHLLDYSCPVKTSVPMSLSLLLHFLKNCTLSPDPKDGTEKWRRWEELVCLLWMLLLSYNNAMKGYLSGSKKEKSDRVGPSVYKPEDMVSKSAVREAVEAFLSRSQDDVGEALPFHVEESLTYLQDHLLDVCHC